MGFSYRRVTCARFLSHSCSARVFRLVRALYERFLCSIVNMKLLGQSIVIFLVHVLLLLCCLDVVNARRRIDQDEKWLRKAVRRHQLSQSQKRQTDDPSSQCAEKTAATLSAPKTNIWWGLTQEEIAAVTKWCFAQKSLNLTKAADAGEWDNILYAPRTRNTVFKGQPTNFFQPKRRVDATEQD